MCFVVACTHCFVDGAASLRRFYVFLIHFSLHCLPNVLKITSACRYSFHMSTDQLVLFIAALPNHLH